jgi:small subunit ribosomal protein S20
VANHESSKKRIRQTAKITERNKHVRSTTRTTIKRVRAAVEAGDKKAAEAALSACVRQIDKAVAKGVYPRATGSRYISRLTTHVHGL